MRTSILAAAAALSLALPAVAGAQYAGQTAGQTAPLFDSKFSLAPGDVNGTWDTYTRIGGQTKLLTDGTGAKAADIRAASSDGSIAFFQTLSPLVASDGDDELDLYVRRPSGIALVAPQSPGFVNFAAMTADGSRAFVSTGQALVAGDTDAKQDVYEFTTATGALTLRTPGTTGAAVNFDKASPNGDVVYFSTTQALLPGDTDASLDTYSAGPAGIKEATPGDGPHPASFKALGTANGRVVFSSSQQLAAADTDAASDLYASIGGGSVDLLTPSPNAAAAAKPVTLIAWDRADAGRVVFSTEEKLLPTDTDATEDIYAHEGQALTLLTPGTTQPVTFEDFSDDGEVILFSTAEKLLGSDTDTRIDMYRATDSGLLHVAPTNGPFDQYAGHLSATGLLIAFETGESLAQSDSDLLVDAYIRGPLGVLTPASNPDGGTGPAEHASPEEFLATNELLFTTTQRLVPEDGNEFADLYVFKGADLSLVSVDGSAPDTLMNAPATVADGAPIYATLAATEQGTLECRVDGGAWAACASQWSAGVLARGVHVLEARAIDVAGNVDATPAQASVKVGEDAVAQTPPVTEVREPVEPPVVTVTPPAPDTQAPVLSGARVRLRRRVPALSFALSEAASVRVVIQRKVGRRWKVLRTQTAAGFAGVNRRTLAKLPRGTFRVLLSATDAAGNASARTSVRVARVA